MFVTEETTLRLPLSWAVAQLSSIAESGRFGEVSDHAYAAGLAVLTRAGPPGDVRGLAKTVEVRLSGPRERKTSVAYVLRWVATGSEGGPFPILDADLSLILADAGSTWLAIIACYRPPPGVQLDRLLLGRMARAVLRSLLDSLAREMTQPAKTLARMPMQAAPQAGEMLRQVGSLPVRHEGSKPFARRTVVSRPGPGQAASLG